VRLRRSDGVFRWFRFVVSRCHDKPFALLDGMGREAEIEDRKREEELAAGEKRSGNGDEAAIR